MRQVINTVPLSVTSFREAVASHCGIVWSWLSVACLGHLGTQQVLLRSTRQRGWFRDKSQPFLNSETRQLGTGGSSCLCQSLDRETDATEIDTGHLLSHHLP